jgi:hypothetical protein
MTLLDDTHIQLLIALIESTALGLMRKGMSGNNRNANSDKMLASALVDCDCVMDFIIGIFACVHPTQVSLLVLAYFNVLEDINAKLLVTCRADVLYKSSYTLLNGLPLCELSPS